MFASHAFSAVVFREAGWWVIEIPEYGQTRQCATLDDVDRTARECVAALLDCAWTDLEADIVIAD